MNLVDGILAECNRNRDLASAYREVGPVGQFAASMIEAEISEAEASLGSGDVVRMLAAYAALRENE